MLEIPKEPPKEPPEKPQKNKNLTTIHGKLIDKHTFQTASGDIIRI